MKTKKKKQNFDELIQIGNKVEAESKYIPCGVFVGAAVVNCRKNPKSIIAARQIIQKAMENKKTVIIEDVTNIKHI